MHSLIPIRIVNASSNPQIGDLFVYGSEFLICLVQNLSINVRTIPALFVLLFLNGQRHQRNVVIRKFNILSKHITNPITQLNPHLQYIYHFCIFTIKT